MQSDSVHPRPPANSRAKPDPKHCSLRGRSVHPTYWSQERWARRFKPPATPVEILGQISGRSLKTPAVDSAVDLLEMGDVWSKIDAIVSDFKGWLVVYNKDADVAILNTKFLKEKLDIRSKHPRMAEVSHRREHP